MKKSSAAKCTECEKRRVIAIVAHRSPLSKRRAVHPNQVLRRHTPLAPLERPPTKTGFGSCSRRPCGL